MRPSLAAIALTTTALLTACSNATPEACDRCSEIRAQSLSHLQQATSDTATADEQQLEALTGINLALDNPECFSEEEVATARSRKEQILTHDSTAP